MSAERRSEPLSAYVRRTRGDIEGCGPDWLADRIAELETSMSRRSVQPTYNRQDTGDRFTLEIRENDQRVSFVRMPDPFHNTTIRVRGWRAAFAVLRGRCVLTVVVGGDQNIVEDILELDDDYRGAHGSTRRAQWDVSFQQALGDFAARAGEATDD